MTYILQLWKKNGPARLKKEYTTFKAARKDAYDKLMFGKTPIKFIEIIDVDDKLHVGTVHWGTTSSGPWKNYDKIVMDIRGDLDNGGWYVHSDGSLTPTEAHKWGKSKKNPFYTSYTFKQIEKRLKE